MKDKDAMQRLAKAKKRSLEELIRMTDEAEANDVKTGLSSVKVMGDSPEALKKGLEKASDIMEDDSLQKILGPDSEDEEMSESPEEDEDDLESSEEREDVGKEEILDDTNELDPEDEEDDDEKRRERLGRFM